MDVQAYISSGILESYVLGQLDNASAREVERIAEQYPEVKKELEQIELSLEKYAFAHQIAPSSSVKNKIFASIDSGQPSFQQKEEAKVVPIHKNSSYTRLLVAASLTTTVISTALSLYFYSKWNKAEDRIIAMQADRTVLADKLNLTNLKLNEKEAETEKLIAFVGDTNTAQVRLKGLPLSPNSGATVLWNKTSGTVMIAVNELPLPPAGMQYQLWALDNGKPLDAGVFNTDTVSIQQLKQITSAQAFAVTLERTGGSPVPTLDKMYLLGTL